MILMTTMTSHNDDGDAEGDDHYSNNDILITINQSSISIGPQVQEDWKVLQGDENKEEEKVVEENDETCVTLKEKSTWCYNNNNQPMSSANEPQK